jgi:hypothetical protein
VIRHAVRGRYQQEDAQDEAQEQETGDGQVSHFPTLASRFVEAVEGQRRDKPQQEDSGSPDDWVGPRNDGCLTTLHNQVQQNAGNQADDEQATGSDQASLIHPLQPFQTWQPQTGSHDDLVLQEIRLDQKHQARQKPDDHRRGAKQQG